MIKHEFIIGGCRKLVAQIFSCSFHFFPNFFTKMFGNIPLIFYIKVSQNYSKVDLFVKKGVNCHTDNKVAGTVGDSG